MQTIFLKKIIWIFFAAFFCISVNAANDSSKLKNIVSQIKKVKTDIIKKEQQRTSVKEQLKILHKKITALEIKYKNTTKNLRTEKVILTKLNQDLSRQQLKLNDEQKTFESQINLAYQIEPDEPIKNVFTEAQTISTELNLGYHHYILMARLEQMQHIDKTLKRIEKNRQEIKRQTKNLERLEKKQQEEKNELEETKTEQNQILSSLKNKIVEQNKRLKKLLRAKKNLENLIENLAAKRLGKISPEAKAKVCSNFVWPTKGQIVTHFGSSIMDSSWKWNGVIISAEEGQEVRAMAAGKVIYADRFTGFGLLLIIDHGNGYMSLYGHNNKIIKRLNREVSAGEVVASVGKSDTLMPELYFAIRFNGKPVDPERWC